MDEQTISQDVAIEADGDEPVLATSKRDEDGEDFIGQDLDI